VSDRRAQAAAVLHAHGLEAVDVGAVLDAAVLRTALEAPDGAELIAALGELGDARVAALLRAFDGGDIPPQMRKAMRRALHRLQERGIDVAAPPPSGSKPALAAAEPEREAWISVADGVGTRLVWVAVGLPSGKWLLVAGEVNDPGGLRDLRVTEVPKKQLRSARQQLREHGIVLVTLPFEAADALLVEAQHRLGEVERKLDYLRTRPRLTSNPPASPQEPRSPRVASPSDEEIDALLADSARLLAEPELRLWWPHPREAGPFLDEIAALEDSPIVLNESQQESRLAALVARAAAALYPRPVMARRLRGTAYVFAETGRLDAARTALAVADAVAQDPAGTRDIPVLSVLAHQGLGRLAASRAAERRQARQGSLVVTPGEALTDRSAGRPTRTRS